MHNGNDSILRGSPEGEVFTIYLLKVILSSAGSTICGQGRIEDFGKGGPGNCQVLKCSVFVHMHPPFFPLYEVWGSPKKGGGEGFLALRTPRTPLLDPPLPSSHFSTEED